MQTKKPYKVIVTAAVTYEYEVDALDEDNAIDEALDRWNLDPELLYKTGHELISFKANPEPSEAAEWHPDAEEDIELADYMVFHRA